MISATSLSTANVFSIGLIVVGGHCVFGSSTLLADFFSSLGTSLHYKQETRSNITIDTNSPYDGNLTSEYVPASSEKYLIQNMKKLNLDGDDHKKVYSYTGCAVWKDKTVAPEIYDDLTEYRKEIIAYHQKIGAMKPIPSIMESIRKQ